jgi:DNA primase
MRDDIDESMHQTLKGAWNGIGREKGKGFESNRTTVDKINSAIYYSGQYLPTRDDGALPSRSIICNFENKEHSPQAKEEYNKLITWNKQGISSFIIDIIKHRDYVSKNLTRVYSETSKELKIALKDQEYQNRIFDNYLQLLVIIKMLEDKFKFPFTYKEYLELTKDSIIENSETIADSDGLAAFWRVIEYLVGEKQIRQSQDFIIERESSFDITVKKGEKTTHINKNSDKILFLNFNKVHQDYHKEVTKRQGEEVIGATTIRNYLKSKDKYFIGAFKSKRMGEKCPSGYAFNYTVMQRMGILNIDDINDTQLEIPEGF